MAYFVIWGVTAIVSAIIAGFLAAAKNRDYSAWAAWTFLFPPLLIALFFTPKYTGPPRPRRRLDDDTDQSFDRLN